MWWHAQQTHDVESLLIYRWSTVYDVVSTLIQHWFNVSRLLGSDVSDADVLVCRTLASTVFWGLRCRSRAQLGIATWRLIRATASEMITAAFDDDQLIRTSCVCLVGMSVHTTAPHSQKAVTSHLKSNQSMALYSAIWWAWADVEYEDHMIACAWYSECQILPECTAIKIMRIMFNFQKRTAALVQF